MNAKAAAIRSTTPAGTTCAKAAKPNSANKTTNALTKYGKTTRRCTVSSVFVPYLERPDTPRSSDLTVLRTELHRCRTTYGRRSEEAAQAFNRLAGAAAAQGRPLDQLDTFITDETERFMSMTVAGTNGHIYWNGRSAARFSLNGGRETTPRIWWWTHIGAERPRAGYTIRPTCGETHCINPRHCRIEDPRSANRRYTDAQMIGSLQVLAMKIGHAHSNNDRKRSGLKPTVMAYVDRFGSWNGALRAAGLSPWARPLITDEACRASLHAAAEYPGRIPASHEYRRADLREHLNNLDLPRNRETIVRRLGAWPDAIKDTFG